MTTAPKNIVTLAFPNQHTAEEFVAEVCLWALQNPDVDLAKMCDVLKRFTAIRLSDWQHARFPKGWQQEAPN